MSERLWGFNKLSRQAMSRRDVLKWGTGGATLVAASVLLSACGGSSESPGTSQATKTVQGGEATASSSASSSQSSVTPPSGSASASADLVLATNFTIYSMDPGRGNTSTLENIAHGLYDSLVTFDGEDLKAPKPWLASSWEASRDGITYTFKLKPDVKFSTKNPMTAQDFVWTFNRVKNLQGQPVFLLDSVSKVEAPADDTFVITLSQPDPAIIPIVSSPNLGVLDSKTLTRRGGDASADAKTKDKAEQFLSSNSVGTGPFTLTRYKPDTEAVLTRNPDYWNDPASLASVTIQNVNDAGSQKAQLVGGSVDIATGITQDQIPSLRGTNGIEVKLAPAASTVWILMNEDPSIGGDFANPKVQDAVRYALDYDGIMELAGPGAVRLAGIFPAVFSGAAPASSAIKSDPAKAKALLKESGISKVSGKFSYASDRSSYGVSIAVLAQKIQSDLNAVGMNVSLDGAPSNTDFQKYFSGNYQIGISSYTIDYPDVSNYLLFAPGGQVADHAHWPADFDDAAKDLAELVKQVQAETDKAKRIQLFEEIDQKIVTVGPFVSLYQPAIPYAFRSSITGVTMSSLWAVDYYAVKKPQ